MQGFPYLKRAPSKFFNARLTSPLLVRLASSNFRLLEKFNSIVLELDSSYFSIHFYSLARIIHTIIYSSLNIGEKKGQILKNLRRKDGDSSVGGRETKLQFKFANFRGREREV